MNTARYVHWQNGGVWLGYFEAQRVRRAPQNRPGTCSRRAPFCASSLVDFPDYVTQGETIAELEEHLRDLYRDLTSNEIPGIRRVAELSVG
jgi:hypothetical protein